MMGSLAVSTMTWPDELWFRLSGETRGLRGVTGEYLFPLKLGLGKLVGLRVCR